MTRLFAAHAWLGAGRDAGWQRDVAIEWDDRGRLSRVQAGARREPDMELAAGAVAPGLVDAHSHAFQRAMAGLGEYRDPGRDDDFWSWRERMYALTRVIEPAQLEAVAAMLYADLLRHGYTSVCEFHYLHHDREGRRYAQPAELGERIAAAAGHAGIGLTMLPVLYRWAGFGRQPPSPAQARFVCDVDELLRIADDLRRHENETLRIGLAPHSLRAADRDDITALLSAAPADAPIHIHVAEQRRELDECVAHTGITPVRWLHESLPVDRRWTLVHATHVDADELAAMRASDCVAGLCPSTEANLGDGLFPLSSWLAGETPGALSIGSDSHVCVSPWEELRWLEYGQRLQLRRRNIAATAATPRPADLLWSLALDGGARSAGRAVGRLQPGARADLIVIDTGQPVFAAREPASWWSTAIFAAAGNPVRDVMVGGRWQVREGRHVAAERIEARWRAAIISLLAAA